MTIKEEENIEDNSDKSDVVEMENQSSPFAWMTPERGSWYLFFLSVLPILWITICAIGWSLDDKVEENVSNIWTKQRSTYNNDKNYAEKFDRATATTTSFLAMASARDGGNLFEPERLEIIKNRMEKTEETTVKYNGNIYTWNDVCASNNLGPGTTYDFPCFRLTPLDFFQESRWFFDEKDRQTWYENVVQKEIVLPRIPRFGVMEQFCVAERDSEENKPCDDLYYSRIDTDPLLLFADIGNMEHNDVCRMCIEKGYEDLIDYFVALAPQLFGNLAAFTESIGDPSAAKYQQILATLDREKIIEFFTYYTIRGLYAELGAPIYLSSWNSLGLGAEVDFAIAKQNILNHADHAFSSSNTGGNFFPIWEDNGEGYLNPMEPGSPVSGSGIAMTGAIFQSLEYLMTTNVTNIDITHSQITTDPVHAWFMAGVTDMTAHCGNEPLKGPNTENPQLKQSPQMIEGLEQFAEAATVEWCTKYSEPFQISQTFSQQHFAKMFYGLVIDNLFLEITEGVSDPYIWTTGQGCGYELKGKRFAYGSTVGVSPTATQEDLMVAASGQLYYIDEGESVGAINTNLLMGGISPENYSPDSPLTKVSTIQNIYPALLPENIVTRVQNCNRPGGSLNITKNDAEEILKEFKERFEDNWVEHWDDDSQPIEFVGFFDDSGVIGTTGRMLNDITLSNGILMTVSIIIILAFSAMFLYSFDVVASQVQITIFGVLLVILAFFASIGFGLIIGIKINITIAWTLPFIILGLGVDDMYISLLALRQQRGYSMEDFIAAMKEVFVPITMTSAVNAAMFGIMNINDVPAIYLTAQVALISVVFLYLTIVFCFPAWCYLDMKRQASGRPDICFCKKKKEEKGEKHSEESSLIFGFLYDSFYKPLLLDANSGLVRVISNTFVWIAAAALLSCGIYGLMEKSEVGLGLEDFFPPENQASRWATIRTQELASWPISMNWGDVDYTDPNIQMRVIKQFEDVGDTSNVVSVDTKQFWLADFAIWTTYQCNENFVLESPDSLECGRDQIFPADNSTCTGVWMPNNFGLREKKFSDLDTCLSSEGGICRPESEMHKDDIIVESKNTSEIDSFCPVFQNWSSDKIQFCIGKWREITGGRGRLVLEEEKGTPTECSGEFKNDETVDASIPFAQSPTMYAVDLFSHQDTIDMINDTREICDRNDDIHCWLSGVPYDYWSQYVDIYDSFWQISSVSVAVGFLVSFAFLLSLLYPVKEHSSWKKVAGSFAGGFLISVTTILSLITVSGLSALFDVSFTGFSIMSYVLSVGFTVEYSVHIVGRWLFASPEYKTSLERVEHAMAFLMLPTFMSFVSSTIGVACLSFTEFDFNEIYFFRPLIIVMFVTYFYGCWWLPVFLTLLDFDCVQLGVKADKVTEENV